MLNNNYHRFADLAGENMNVSPSDQEPATPCGHKTEPPKSSLPSVTHQDTSLNKSFSFNGLWGLVAAFHTFSFLSDLKTINKQALEEMTLQIDV